jgi:Ni,Fe-hydrogenase III small subunit
MGRCLFCPECVAVCPAKKITFTSEYRLCARNREDLIIGPDEKMPRAQSLDGRTGSMFKRSFKLREVSAAGCNACEADTNVLSTLAWDLGRFGIQFVASPRHADAMFVTGPVSENMHMALIKTWEAIPEPKILIACGSCAISGGPFAGNSQVHSGLEDILPVDLYIPGCPPHPATIMDGLLRLTGRVE